MVLALSILLIAVSFLLVLLVLLHKGKGGGVSTNLGGSSIAERNLDRITILLALVWFAAVIALGLIAV